MSHVLASRLTILPKVRTAIKKFPQYFDGNMSGLSYASVKSLFRLKNVIKVAGYQNIVWLPQAVFSCQYLYYVHCKIEGLL